MYRSVYVAILCAVFFSSINAQCPNQCSRNGICTEYSKCRCFTGYTGSDCSNRTCPTGIKYADIASKHDTAHAEVECSDNGLCDRDEGLCKCFDGYHGSDCGKKKCPNDCNNRGKCISLRTAASTFDGWSLNHTTTYTEWDADTSYGCQCDPGWSGHDCSEKKCDAGVDPRYSENNIETVTLVCTCTPTCTGKFKLRFLGLPAQDWLYPTSTATEVATSIMSIPGFYGNSLAYSTTPVTADVESDPTNTICHDSITTKTRIHFNRKGGDVAALSFAHNKISGDLHFETTQALICDCLNRLCNGTFHMSYEGEMSPSINIQDNTTSLLRAMSNMRTITSSGITVANVTTIPVITDPFEDQPICTRGVIMNHTITFSAASGNLPLLELFTSAVPIDEPDFFSTNDTANVLTIVSNDGRNTVVKECNGLGKCDYETGQCTCAFGWEPDPDIGPCGRLTINTSDWNGLARCPGTQSRDAPIEDWSSRANHNRLYLSLNPDARYFNKLSTIEMWEIITDSFENKPRIDVLNATVIVSLTTNTSAGPLLIDRAKDFLYYVDNNADSPFIGRFFLSVNGTETAAVASWLALPEPVFGFAMDAHFARRKIYWTVPGTVLAQDGKIYWASLDALVPVANDLTATIGQNMLVDPMGIAIHYYDQRIYWVDTTLAGAAANTTCLRSCLLDGTSCMQEYVYVNIANVSSPSNATDFTIDLRNNTGYFINTRNENSISRTNLHTPTYLSNVENPRDYYNVDVIVQSDTLVLESPQYIYLDPIHDVLIYTQPDTNSVRWVDIKIEEPSDILDVRLIFDSTDDLVHEVRAPVGIVIDDGMENPHWAAYEECYGHGRCKGLAGGWECVCHEGFYGDCQLRTCPKGPACEPYVPDIAHDRLVECSNAGSCNRVTGLCECDDGYEGSACERSTCPSNSASSICSNNGRCLSMRQLASHRVSTEKTSSPVIYGRYEHNAHTWDADMIYGCHGDEYGYVESIHYIAPYVGRDLTELDCPVGYDSRLLDALSNKGPHFMNLEVQMITCIATTGAFTLGFRGQTTSSISFDDSISSLESYLEGLSTIGNVTITSSSDLTDPICSAGGTSANITFNTELGSIPVLSIESETVDGSVTVDEVIPAQGTLYTCAYRGDCDRSTGECRCWKNRMSSDGLGNIGTRGDCGYDAT